MWDENTSAQLCWSYLDQNYELKETSSNQTGQSASWSCFCQRNKTNVPSKLLKHSYCVWVQTEYCPTSSITSITLCTLYWQRLHSWASCVSTVEFWAGDSYSIEKAKRKKRVHSPTKKSRKPKCFSIITDSWLLISNRCICASGNILSHAILGRSISLKTITVELYNLGSCFIDILRTHYFIKVIRLVNNCRWFTAESDNWRQTATSGLYVSNSKRLMELL